MVFFSRISMHRARRVPVVGLYGVCTAERVWRTALVEGMICSWALGEARTLRRRVLRPRFCMLVCLPMSWLVAEAHAVWFFFLLQGSISGTFYFKSVA